MTVIDNHGRLFGRINLVDAAVALFVFALIPSAYGTVLLFRPSKPQIASVTPAELNSADRRVSAGSQVAAKFKLRGSGFTPLLRASIDNTPALAFVFENPNSADVMVGRILPGQHDLILFDGVQEVARAPAPATITAVSRPAALIHAAGRLIGLESDAGGTFGVGFKFPASEPVFEVLAIGPAQPAQSRMILGNGFVDLPSAGRVDREALLRLRCDPAGEDGRCEIAGQSVTPSSRRVQLPGPDRELEFEITDIFPPTSPNRAQAEVRFTGGLELELLRAGDRDALLDERAATIVAIIGRERSGTERVVNARIVFGLDGSRDGWRYRGRLVKPGATITLTTDRYVAEGRLQTLATAGSTGESRP